MQFFRGFGIKEGTERRVFMQPLLSADAFAVDYTISIRTEAKMGMVPRISQISIRAPETLCGVWFRSLGCAGCGGGRSFKKPDLRIRPNPKP